MKLIERTEFREVWESNRGQKYVFTAHFADETPPELMEELTKLFMSWGFFDDPEEVVKKPDLG